MKPIAKKFIRLRDIFANTAWKSSLSPLWFDYRLHSGGTPNSINVIYTSLKSTFSVAVVASNICESIRNSEKNPTYSSSRSSKSTWCQSKALMQQPIIVTFEHLVTILEILTAKLENSIYPHPCLTPRLVGYALEFMDETSRKNLRDRTTVQWKLNNPNL